MLYIKHATICFLSLCASISSQNIPSNIKEFSDVMLNDVVRLCRTAQICEANKSESVETPAGQKGVGSCCQDCSCDENCGLREDCCFPSTKQRALLQYKRKDQECIALLTKDLVPMEYYKYEFYYMTTECPANKTNSHSDSRHYCGSARVAPWGSLLPIYSKSRGTVYKNRVCADCHGVRDGVLFKTFMGCKGADATNTRQISVAENFEWLSRNSLPENCNIRFKVPQPIATERCFPNLIDSCDDSQEVAVPEWSKLTKEQIISACHSGMATPFQLHRAYSNVFCFLCNGGTSKGAEFCHSPDADQLSTRWQFTSLLNIKTLESATSLKTRKPAHRTLLCKKHANQHKDDSCVFVLCPSGQIYNKEFRCVHPATAWKIPFYHVALRLRFVSDGLSISAFMTLLQGARDVSTWLHCPWPRWWDVNSLYFETGNGTFQSGYVESFIIFLKMRPGRRKHLPILNEIKTQMTKMWAIKTSKENISLTGDFLEYTHLNPMFAPNSQLQFVPDWYFHASKDTITQDIPFFRENSILPIIQRVEYIHPSGKINKMNFCKQISLGTNSSNYDILASEKLLSYNGTVFLDGEFELISTEDGAREPRICLEDSQYREQLSSAASISSQTSACMLSVLTATFYNFAYNRDV